MKFDNIFFFVSVKMKVTRRLCMKKYIGNRCNRTRQRQNIHFVWKVVITRILIKSSEKAFNVLEKDKNIAEGVFYIKYNDR